MTRAEVIAAVERQLGRPLRPEEIAYVDSRVEGETIQNRHIPLLVADIASGRYEALTDPPQPDPVPGDPQPLPGAAEGPDVFATRQREASAGTGQFLPSGVSQETLERAYEVAVSVGASESDVEAAVNRYLAEAQSYAQTDFDPPEDFPATAEQFLEEAMEAWKAAGPAGGRSPIGVPGPSTTVNPVTGEQQVTPGFVAFRQGRPNQGAGTLGGEYVGADDMEVEPRYFDGDQFNPAGLAPERIIQLQSRMEKAGLIGDGSEFGDYYAGVWDHASVNAYASVLAQANRSGARADGALTDMINNIPDSVKEARNAAKLAKQFQAPAFLKADPATLEQMTKQAFRSRVGRDPTAEEMAEFTSHLSGLYRQDYEAEVAAMRSEFAATQQGLETGTAATPAATQDVDFVQSFNKFADMRLGSEMDFAEDQAATADATQRVLSSMGFTGRLIG